MMNLNQAIAYGKKNGVKWYVKNNYGCIMSGCKTKAQAEQKAAEYRAKYAKDKLNSDMRFTVVEA